MLMVVVEMKEYLNELTKEQLLDIAYFNKSMTEYMLLTTKSKKDVYNYVVTNIDSIFDEITKFVLADVNMDIYDYFEEKGRYVFSEEEYNDDFYYTRVFLNALHFIKVKRKHGDYEVSIVKDIFDKLVVEREDEGYLEYYDKIMNKVNVYGVIDIKDLEKLLSCEDASYIIHGFRRLYQTFYIYTLNGKTLVSHLIFNTLDKAFDFYELIDETDLTIPDFNLYSLASYKKLIRFIKKEFFVSYYDDDSDYYEYALGKFRLLFIMPYLEMMQINEDDAASNLAEDLNMYTDVTEQQFNQLISLFDQVYKDIPKWKLGGKIK